MRKNFPLELLSPAANREIAKAAVMHGADAVYMGGPSHGARKSVSNSLDDIAETVDFAHNFRAKVYVTVNTIIYNNELTHVRNLCRDLYHIGVDALIIQDMSILRMDIPPIALHASTQCDIRTPEKAEFLERVGFSQLVLERSLTLEEIKTITETVNIPVECFVHGALCVSYSGRCHASYKCGGRSANRGECSQICRLPFDLVDAKGNKIKTNSHLLSLKDLNQIHNIELLINEGVSSFKIEGRLKEIGYVKNITGLYNNKLNEIINNSHKDLRRSSFGEVNLGFKPEAFKSFNRGFTPFFLLDRQKEDIANFITPKSMGERIKSTSQLNNGDGISYLNKNGEFFGVNINSVKNGKIIPARKVEIPRNALLYRTYDTLWQKIINSETSSRKIRIKLLIELSGVSVEDEMGNFVKIPWNCNLESSNKPMDYKREFEKLGNTIFKFESYKSELPEKTFIPRSKVSELRRKLLENLKKANKITYKYDYRRVEDKRVIYPYNSFDFRDNVANCIAENFYKSHGVSEIQPSIETSENKNDEKKIILMTSRHCLLRELGMCKKRKGSIIEEPLYLYNGKKRFKLEFDCKKCEMKVLGL